jgi:RNA polymerase-binding transcription factor DksA
VSGERPDPSPADDAVRLDEISEELEAVDAALRRLDDASYGTCEVCGTALEATHLETDPLTTRCADHRR